ncbi:MAG: LptF/LptG family permease [Parachlamydiales bacterium]|nr:LptF/LptG family permease [Parachlamydiales bacterium]
MPHLWRYLISQFFKVMILTATAFMAVLVVTRLEETARFAAMGATLKHIFLFNLYEMPHTLPLALPLSCLLSAFVLTRRMSVSYEISALRACGISLKEILLPVMVAASIVAIANTYIVSEITTRTHLASRQMINQLTSMNPLVILQNVQFLKQKEVFVETGKRNGAESAQDVVVVVNNKNQGRLNLFTAKKLSLNEDVLKGEQTCLISSLPTTEDNNFDHLILENERSFFCPAAEFSQILKKTRFRLSVDYLCMPMLLHQASDIQNVLDNNVVSVDKKTLKQQLNKIHGEIIRRFSYGLSPIAFTFLGATMGLSIGRKRSQKPLWLVIGLATLTMSTFVTAKETGKWIYLAIILYSLPYLLISFVGVRRVNRLSRGEE